MLRPSVRRSPRSALWISGVALALGLLASSGLQAQPAAAAPPGYPVAPVAPKSAPNILIVMTDDVGFAASSTFGGLIPTPTFDGLAAQGVRFNNFNTAALCSPTRATLLTGRNHHAVGFGNVTDMAVREPGYSSVMPKSAATIGQVLKANGYSTAWFGKNHNVPSWQDGPLGPFDQWARGLGFDYFYGFNGGWTDQFAPALVENETPIEPPASPDYILDRDLADHAIGWLRMQRTQGQGKPFLLYYAPGTAHAPVQAPKAWIERFRGKFDAGWDAYRAEVFDRQKRMGVIPSDAKLTPLPPGVPTWASLSPDEKRVFARYMEVYAAALSYCDVQLGRVLDSLRESGQLDNTLVIYIQGDNGASAEGGRNGTLNYATYLPGDPDIRRALEHLDEIGGPKTEPIAPAGWAVAMDTPFPYYKVVASRLGGVRNGMVVSWPARVKARGVRNQFTHVTDVAPTIYALAGVTPPAEVAGVRQEPLDGISFAYALDDPGAKPKHRVQYFEILGNAALYEDGWLAASPLAPGGQAGANRSAFDQPWQLFDLNADFSQSQDVSAQHPEKLAHLRAVFEQEARRNHVLPLSTNPFAALPPERRPHPANAAGRHQFYSDGWRYGEGTFPTIQNRSWAVEADLVVPPGGGDGALVTQGGRFSGWGLLMVRGAPTFVYRRDLDQAVRLDGSSPLAAGPHRVRVEFTVDGPGVGRGGEFRMTVDGKPAAAARLDRSVPFKFSAEPGLIGRDAGAPLLDDYRPPFAYGGELRVTMDLEPVETGGGS